MGTILLSSNIEGEDTTTVIEREYNYNNKTRHWQAVKISKIKDEALEVTSQHIEITRANGNS